MDATALQKQVIVQSADSVGPAPHPRKLGWLGTTALAMGGSNQMLFLVGALIVGQGSIPGQGTAAIPLLFVGLILGWMAAPGWTELVLMWPNRVGGIAATCGEAFRPYAPVLGNLTGIAYWWGWVPTCGVCALLSAGAINQWFLPNVSVPLLACGLIALFATINMFGVQRITWVTIPIGFASAILAFLSAVVPIWAGKVDWHQSFSFHLVTPFPGWFGSVTSAMAGLYLVGFAAPAFEAAACHVGETKDYARNVPRAMFASAIMATVYFLVLPVVWLGTIGGDAMAGDLAATLGPTFAPLLGGLGRAAAMGFMMFNMFHGTIAPLTGVCRTLSQLSEDGLLPEFFAKRIQKTDAPWVAITVTAVLAMGGVLIGDPVWFIAAANLTYLIGISLPNVAVWLLRKDMPKHPRPYRAPRGTIALGLIAALVWAIATILGFEQFGLPVVIFGIALAYSGSILYAWRRWSDHRKAGSRGIPHSLHVKLTGAMMIVLLLDGTGYYIAVRSAVNQTGAMITALEDIFVVVALLTISVGLVLPGTIAHSAVELAKAAERLATGTLADFSTAMQALASGDLDAAHARVDVTPVVVHTRDEVGRMAEMFNTMQSEVARAATSLDGAREGLRRARTELQQTNAGLEQRVLDRTAELETAHKKLVDAARQAGMAEVATDVLHNVGNVLNSVNTCAGLLERGVKGSRSAKLTEVAALLKQQEADLSHFLTSDPRGRQIPAYLAVLAEQLGNEQSHLLQELACLHENIDHVKHIVHMQQSMATATQVRETLDLPQIIDDAVRINYAAGIPQHLQVDRSFQDGVSAYGDKHRVLLILVNLISNSKYAVTQIDKPQLHISLELRQEAGNIIIRVSDNGAGIAPQNMCKLFTHGFTTKKNGHGFGLHSSALAAKDLGGTLIAESAGPGLGASFTLGFPATLSETLGDGDAQLGVDHGKVAA